MRSEVGNGREVQEDRAQHPWLGLESYKEGDEAVFHGRREEAEELFRMVKREVLTILFGPSGVGKTSLVRAGLFPKLRASHYLPVWVRLVFSREAPPLRQQVKATLAQEVESRRITVEEIAALNNIPANVTLWEYLHCIEFWDQRLQPITPVIVFDQFEELFTLGLGNSAAKEMSRKPKRDCVEFLSELADLIENQIPETVRERLDASDSKLCFPYQQQHYKVVFSLREDFVPNLDRLRQLMPSVMHNRIPLLPMNGDQALQAVLLPGRHLVEPETATKIVLFVAGADEERDGVRLGDLAVEPAYLSMVCRDLNLRRLQEGEDIISVALLTGSREKILKDFYELSINGLSEEVRIFIEDELLTSSGYRNSMAIEDATKKYGITETNLALLENRRLLRREERLKVPRVELVHDLLTGVIRKSRDERVERRRREQEWEEDHKIRVENRRLKIIAFSFGMLALGILFACLIVWKSERIAKRNEHVANLNLAAFFQEEGRRALLNDEANRSAVFLAAAYALSFGDEKVGLGGAGMGSKAVGILLNRSLHLLNAEAAKPFHPHANDLNSIFFDAAGARLLTIGKDKNDRDEIGIWDVKDEKDGKILVSPGQRDHYIKCDYGSVVRVGKFCFGKDASSILLGENCTVLLKDLNTGETSTLGKEPVRVKEEEVLFGPWEFVKRQAENSNHLMMNFDHELGHTGYINDMDFSSDGKIAVTASNDGLAIIWDLASKRKRKSFNLMSKVNSAKFDLSSRFIVTASGKTAKVWDVDTGDEKLTLKGHYGLINEAVFSPLGGKGDIILTASSDGTARLWDTTTGKCRRILPGHFGGIRSAIFNPADGGETIATLDDDGNVRFWNTADGNLIQSFYLRQNKIVSIAFRPNSDFLFVGLKNGWVRVLKFPKGRIKKSLEKHSNRVVMAAYSPDDSLIVTASHDSTAKLWKGNGDLIHVLPHRNGDWVVQAVFNKDGTLLATVGSSSVKIWKVKGKVSLLAEIPAPDEVRFTGAKFQKYDVIFTAVSRRNKFEERIHSSNDGEMAWVKWRLTDGGAHQEAEGGKGSSQAIGLSDDGDAVMTFGEGQVSLARSDGGLLGKIAAAGNEVTFAALAPESKRVAVGRVNGAIEIYDTAGKKLESFENHHDGRVNWVSFNNDETQVVTAGSDKTARVWAWEVSSKTASLKAVLSGHLSSVQSACFNPDSTLVVTSSSDGTAKLWDVKSGKEIATLAGHSNMVCSAVFKPSSDEVLTASWDGTAKIWGIPFKLRDPSIIAAEVLDTVEGTPSEEWLRMAWGTLRERAQAKGAE